MRKKEVSENSPHWEESILLFLLSFLCHRVRWPI